ncbi:MAG: peptide ABC transporter substrate-binding protein [Acidobacteriota bacterium]
MARIRFSQTLLSFAIVVLSLIVNSCTSSANNRFFGKTEAPKENVLKYISGSEPESLDPQVPTGQPEARVLMAIYDGLLEYHPKTMEPIPAIAESWEVSKDGTEYIFYLRKNAKFSNGEPITAKDFVYTLRRAMSPELAAQNAYLAYYIKYAEAYNGGKLFIKDEKGEFLLNKDFEAESGGGEASTSTLGVDTDFHKFIKSPERLTVDSDSFTLAKSIEGDEKLRPYFKLKASDLKDGKAFVGKIQAGTDGISKLLQNKLGNALSACSTTCDDTAKQNLVDGLNKVLAEESLNSEENTTGLTLSEPAKKLIGKFTAENKTRSENNQKLDEEIAKAETPEDKETKTKKKKQPLTKLFYTNRVLLEDYYQDSFEKMSLAPAKAEDMGIEAIDDYTLRITLYQPAPFFIGLIPHQFFRVVHQNTVEKFTKDWTKPANIVTSGSFKLIEHKPYDRIIVEKDPQNWDAANTKLERIEFYPSEEATTMMNLYKSNNVYAVYNHTPPAAWNEYIKQFKDEYLNLPEVANEYYTFNVKKAPTDNPKVRQAFALAVDREALSKFRKTTKPLFNFVPEGILSKYDEARNKVFAEELKANKISAEDWGKRMFDGEQARRLLGEAGYPVVKNGNGWSCPTFPVDKISVTYNTAESNKSVAEFMQAQWKQNLGITVPLKNMEWKTFLPVRKAVDYLGMARAGWVGDYMDPYTFLNLFYRDPNDSSTGWHDAKFDKMLDDANKEIDPQKRFEILAKAEFYLLQNQPIVPLQTQATNWIKKPFVKGLYPNPGTLHAWKFIYIERDQNKWDTNVDNIMTTPDAVIDEQINQLESTQKTFEAKKQEAAKTAKVE